MDLWIRSQDKMKLLNNCNFIIENMNDEWWIEDVSYNKFWKLANYKTKERTLEVLDEIQDELISTSTVPIFNNEKITCGCARVYEMPKE